MNLIVGGSLAPVPSPLLHRPRPPSRPGPGLRLPSFLELGIAAPHPDRFGGLCYDDAMLDVLDGATAEVAASEPVDAGTVEGAFDLLRVSATPFESPNIEPKLSRSVVRTPFRHDVVTLTPPAETGEPTWIPMVTASASPLEPAADHPGNSLDSQTHTGVDPPPPRESAGPCRGADGPHAWLDGALHALLRHFRSVSIPNNPLRVLSHALPSPSPIGYIFPVIINAVHDSTPSHRTEWINVFHAMQGRFNLADMPTSPPSTPGPPIGGDDYFTQKVFDSAVQVSDYQSDLSSLPRTPRPVVPPASINLSIVERYIPPTSAHEFRHMFDTNGPSILVDRLVELSPDRGSLVFVYPTKAGGETFMKDYLGPIIDPLLRSIVVVNGLSSDLSRTLGRSVAASQLPDFDQMQRSMALLCRTLTQRSATMQGFHGAKATFSILHASKAEVPLNREAWARDWWTRQEKPRIREAMSKYAQEAQKKSSNEYIERSPTATELVQQLMDGILKRPYPEGQEPRTGVEVCVFVIQRSE